MRDELRVATGRVSDEDLRAVELLLSRAAATDALPVGQRLLLADLAAGLRDTLTDRVHRWLSLLADSAVPPSWGAATAALCHLDTDVSYDDEQ